ncbi:AMP-binding protein [Nonomuraea ferruginea]
MPRVILGGEPLPPDLAARLLKVAGELWNFYGPTETTIWSTAYRVPRDATTILIGTPVANTSVYVVDGGVVSGSGGGVPGELLVGGVGVSRGYHGRAGLTGGSGLFRIRSVVVGGGGCIGRVIWCGGVLRGGVGVSGAC